MKKHLISQAEFGRRIGVSKQRVSVYVRDGMITLVDGKVDPVLARRQLARNLDQFRRQDYEINFEKKYL